MNEHVAIVKKFECGAERSVLWPVYTAHARSTGSRTYS